MENENQKPQNGAALPSEGSSVVPEQTRDENEIKEGNPAKQRPEFGGKAGNNTANSDAQVPTANDGKPNGPQDGLEDLTD